MEAARARAKTLADGTSDGDLTMPVVEVAGGSTSGALARRPAAGAGAGALLLVSASGEGRTADPRTAPTSSGLDGAVVPMTDASVGEEAAVEGSASDSVAGAGVGLRALEGSGLVELAVAEQALTALRRGVPDRDGSCFRITIVPPLCCNVYCILDCILDVIFVGVNT